MVAVHISALASEVNRAGITLVNKKVDVAQTDVQKLQISQLPGSGAGAGEPLRFVLLQPDLPFMVVAQVMSICRDSSLLLGFDSDQLALFPLSCVVRSDPTFADDALEELTNLGAPKPDIIDYKNGQEAALQTKLEQFAQR